MKKVRDVFFVAKIDGKWLDDGISIWTWILAAVSLGWDRLKYGFSHQEKWFPNRDGVFEFLGVPVGECFSSTTRGDAEGVRFAPAAKVLKHPERWLVIEREVTDGEYYEMLWAARREIGKKYDYWGLVTGFFMMAKFLQNDKKWYCSDICMYLDFVAGLLKKRLWIVSPRRAAAILVKAGNVIRPLVEILKESEE